MGADVRSGTGDHGGAAAGRLPAGTRVLVLTISDRCARGEQEDRAGPLVERIAREAGASVVERRVLPDERAEIVTALLTGSGTARLILTTGGTGLAPRDVTPEATGGRG